MNRRTSMISVRKLSFPLQTNPELQCCLPSISYTGTHARASWIMGKTMLSPTRNPSLLHPRKQDGLFCCSCRTHRYMNFVPAQRAKTLYRRRSHISKKCYLLNVVCASIQKDSLTFILFRNIRDIVFR